MLANLLLEIRTSHSFQDRKLLTIRATKIPLPRSNWIPPPMFDPQRNSRRVTFWHCSTRNPLDARSRVGATFVILSDTIQNLLRTYPRYGLFPFSWLVFQDFRFVMESKLHPSKIRIVDRTIRRDCSNLMCYLRIYLRINWRVYRSLKFYTFRRISKIEIWYLDP